MTTVSTAGAGKAMGEDAAGEVAAEFPRGRRWRSRPCPVILQCQPGGKMGLYRAVEQCALGLAAVVEAAAGRGAGDGGHGRPARWSGTNTVSNCQTATPRLFGSGAAAGLLGAHLRTLVQTSAALGREFEYRLLQAVTSLPDAELEPLLGQLVVSGLIHQRGAPPDAAVDQVPGDGHHAGFAEARLPTK